MWETLGIIGALPGVGVHSNYPDESEEESRMRRLCRALVRISNEIVRANIADRRENGSSGGQDYADLYAATTACAVGSLGQVGITRRSA